MADPVVVAQLIADLRRKTQAYRRAQARATETGWERDVAVAEAAAAGVDDATIMAITGLRWPTIRALRRRIRPQESDETKTEEVTNG